MNTYGVVMFVVLLVVAWLTVRSWRLVPPWCRKETIKADLVILSVAVALVLGLAYCAKADANHETIPGINEMAPVARTTCTTDKDGQPMFAEESDKDVVGEVQCLGMQKIDGTFFLIFEKADGSAFEMWLFDHANKKRERIWRAKKKGEVNT